ncbi:hypothetical protein NBO_16g0008 [Nosema bombycis CQ1]|uniref:Uncharacterized protein n=1 Tax=Nosema bombycis (strain CQ1 / CVCC 102059) TaxID=578461 RepID=R0KWW5_NOSB1|nr:hypothetical protein NBO_16g0008 [Nosema bombycis CQ1]|eukprot:EOB14722.1 hypothetical protein NBO_16g0008 [Nosema bombycis CQ1]
MNKEEAHSKIKNTDLMLIAQELTNLNLIFKKRENEFKEIYAKKELYEMHKQKANKIQEEKHKIKIIKEEIKRDEENLKKEIKVMKGKMVRKIKVGDECGGGERGDYGNSDQGLISLYNAPTFDNQNTPNSNNPAPNTLNQNIPNSNTPIVPNLHSYYQNIFNFIFEDFDFQLNSKKLKLNKLEDEISLLREGIRSKNQEINENKLFLSNLISNHNFFEDDPLFDTNVSYENLIKKLKENLSENEIKNLIKKQEDLQMKYQEELKMNKEIYEMNKKRERIKEIQGEINFNMM